MNKEVQPASKLEGTLSLPPDKSISHRAAMFASLHRGESEIRNYSAAADPQDTLSCMRQLGVDIEQEGTAVLVKGRGRDGLKQPVSNLDCGNSGTTIRLLSGIVGGAGVSCTLTGDESLSARTMRRIIDPLSRMGITIRARNGDFAPLEIKRTGPVHPLEFELPIPSAQLKSCVLLAGLFGDEPTRVIETLPSRDHTERLLKLPVEEDGRKRIISSSSDHEIPAQTYAVPNDFSAAAFWLVAGCIHPNASIYLNAVGINPTRTAALDILQNMGANISIENERTEGAEPVADLSVKSSVLQPVDITGEVVPNCIDELPILTVAMLFADGVSTISGAQELRHKETDRLKAMAEILQSAGADFTEFDDGLEVRGNPHFQPRPANYSSYHDHRIAMAAAVLAMMGEKPSNIIGAECAAISYPSFWDDLKVLTN